MSDDKCDECAFLGRSDPFSGYVLWKRNLTILIKNIKNFWNRINFADLQEAFEAGFNVGQFWASG